MAAGVFMSIFWDFFVDIHPLSHSLLYSELIIGGFELEVGEC